MGYDSTEIRVHVDFWMDSETIIKFIRRTGVETVYDRRFRKLCRRRTIVERFFSKLESMSLLRRFRVFGTRAIEKLFRLIGIGFLVLALLAVRTRRKALLRSPKRLLRCLRGGSRDLSHPTSPSGCAGEDWKKPFREPGNGQGRGRFQPLLGRDLGREERLLCLMSTLSTGSARGTNLTILKYLRDYDVPGLGAHLFDWGR